MNFTLRQLAVFEAVARNLSFTRAASELHLSQPGVSMQVRQLEQVVGLTLYEKVGRHIQLTEAGREMFHYSQRVSRELIEAEEVFTGLKGAQRGHLRISVATTANHFATRLLAAFAKEYQDISFTLDVTNRTTLLKQLADYETDLVIMGKPPRPEEFEATPFMENPLVVIAPVDHELANNPGPISLEQIRQEPFVLREADSGTRTAMERFFAERELTFKAGMEMTSNEAIKHAVEAGLGLGIVSIHTIELELEAKRLVVLPVTDFPIQRYWYLVNGVGKRLPPIADAFFKFVMNSVERLPRPAWCATQQKGVARSCSGCTFAVPGKEGACTFASDVYGGQIIHGA